MLFGTINLVSLSPRSHCKTLSPSKQQVNFDNFSARLREGSDSLVDRSVKGKSKRTKIYHLY